MISTIKIPAIKEKVLERLVRDELISRIFIENVDDEALEKRSYLARELAEKILDYVVPLDKKDWGDGREVFNKVILNFINIHNYMDDNFDEDSIKTSIKLKGKISFQEKEYLVREFFILTELLKKFHFGLFYHKQFLEENVESSLLHHIREKIELFSGSIDEWIDDLIFSDIN